MAAGGRAIVVLALLVIHVKAVSARSIVRGQTRHAEGRQGRARFVPPVKHVWPASVRVIAWIRMPPAALQGHALHVQPVILA